MNTFDWLEITLKVGNPKKKTTNWNFSYAKKLGILVAGETKDRILELLLQRKPNLKRTLKKGNGFTLIELMFTSGILLLAFGMILGSLVSIAKVGQVAMEREEAPLVLSNLVEDLRKLPFHQLEEFNLSQHTPPDKRTEITLDYITDASERIALPTGFDRLPEVLPNPIEIQIVVTRSAL